MALRDSVIEIETRKYFFAGEYTAVLIQVGSTAVELRLPSRARAEIEYHILPPLTARR